MCVWLHYFLPLILSDFSFVFSGSTFGKAHLQFFRLPIYSLSLSLCLQLIFPPSFYIKHFPHFCLRISLICVGGCLVCVLIIFYLLHLLLLAIFFSWFIFFLFNLTFDFFFREGLIIFFTHTIYRWSSCLQSVFSVVTLSHHLHSFCFCIWGARVGWEGFSPWTIPHMIAFFFHHSSLILIGLSFLITRTHRENNKSSTNHNHHEQKTKSLDHWESKQFSLRESHRKFFVCSC